MVKAISGVHTVRFKNELERNITIKLGKNHAIWIMNVTSRTAHIFFAQIEMAKKNQHIYEFNIYFIYFIGISHDCSKDKTMMMLYYISPYESPE